MMLDKLVSIIIPTYNRGSLIAESLDSILNQSYQNWECIIIDDGSSDNTFDVVNPYVIKDKRIKILNRPDFKPKGANACRNYGLSLSKGDFVLWFDSDDIIHPNCLEVCLKVIHANNVDFCRFNKVVFSGNNHNYTFSKPEVSGLIHVDKGNLLDMLSHKIPFNTCTVLWKRDGLGNEGFSEEILYADEWEFFSRLLASGLKGVSIETVLFYVRKHEHSTTAEFWKHKAVRRNSKVKASELVILNLKRNQLLDYKLAKYFVSLALFLKQKAVYHILLKNINHFTAVQKIKLRLRYQFDFIIKPLYKVKKKIKGSATK